MAGESIGTLQELTDKHISSSNQQPINLQFQPQVVQAGGRMDLASMVIGNFTLPPELMENFWHILSESNILGNLENNDILLFQNMYDEWENDFLISIPHRKLNEPLIINFAVQTHLGMKMESKKYDLNEMLDRLKQTYYFSLRRSRQGYTLDKLTVVKQIYADETPEVKKGWSLFGRK